MKSLIVYYSFSGNTRKVAEVLKEVLSKKGEVNIFRLEAEDESNNFFIQCIRAFIKKRARIKQAPQDTAGYDLICIGTPVWAFNFTPALRTFFSEVKLTGKKIALFCCSGGGKGKTLEKMKEELAGNTFLGEIAFVEPLRKNREENAREAAKWAVSIMEGIAS